MRRRGTGLRTVAPRRAAPPHPDEPRLRRRPRDAARARRRGCRRGWATACTSSARISSRSSASRSAAPTTGSAHLAAAERARGVITASAGNHAQGVACSAQKLGLRAVIVMPRTTPSIKVQAVQARGAEVVLVGDSYSDAQAHCDRLAAETGLTFIHPFDDPLVIAGQGTVGDEIVRHRQGEALHAVFVPVGGGGLLAGVAGYIKAVLPDVRVVGVEPFESDAMYQSLQAGHRVTLDHVGIFADGVAVRTVGAHTFQIAQLAVDEIVRVSNDEMCAAIKDIFDDTRSVMEPAGALSRGRPEALGGRRRAATTSTWSRSSAAPT